MVFSTAPLRIALKVYLLNYQIYEVKVDTVAVNVPHRNSRELKPFPRHQFPKSFVKFNT